jgi:molybdopterin converting factor subunit 1
MKVRVRLFAGLRELIGQQEIIVDLAEEATVADLRDQLCRDYPRLTPFLPALACAVNEDYKSPEHRLQDGDEVALIPPVSGGSPCSR